MFPNLLDLILKNAFRRSHLCGVFGGISMPKNDPIIGSARSLTLTVVSHTRDPHQALLMIDAVQRCGPFPPALEALQQPTIQDLVRSMVSEVIPISSGLEAISLAQTKGVLKVQLRMDASS